MVTQLLIDPRCRDEVGEGVDRRLEIAGCGLEAGDDIDNGGEVGLDRHWRERGNRRADVCEFETDGSEFGDEIGLGNGHWLDLS